MTNSSSTPKVFLVRSFWVVNGFHLDFESQEAAASPSKAVLEHSKIIQEGKYVSTYGNSHLPKGGVFEDVLVWEWNGKGWDALLTSSIS